MNKIILIYGMPASGKTTLAISLADRLKQKNIGVKILFGDNFANISYGCTYSEVEMDLKYVNMISVMNNLLSLHGMLIIDDFFKRIEDFKKIEELARKNNIDLILFRVTCGFEERIIRDGFRNSGKKLGIKRMKEYEERYGNILQTLDYGEEFDTAHMGINDIVCIMEKMI